MRVPQVTAILITVSLIELVTIAILTLWGREWRTRCNLAREESDEYRAEEERLNELEWERRKLKRRDIRYMSPEALAEAQQKGIVTGADEDGDSYNHVEHKRVGTIKCRFTRDDDEPGAA
jgi:hypothetical protein